jgi:hypothetical protein
VKRALLVTTALAAVVVLLAGLSLPPARLALPAGSDAGVAGAIHVHTNRSDGLGSPDEIARAAARAGLSFVVFTDHGDATRSPDPPTYRQGVLCLDGVEVSTAGGHYLAFDMPAAPYPLGGEARDVVDDVRRLGGIGIVAHPDSPKPELQWRDTNLPVDGIEILNLDTSWRRLLGSNWQGRARLVRTLFAYPFRSAEAMGSLAGVSPENAALFAALTLVRPTIAVAGVDAHARLAWNTTDPQADGAYALRFPGYEAVFRTLVVRVRPDHPLTGDASTDAGLITRAFRAGHLHSAVSALAAPVSFEFTAENGGGSAQEGARLVPSGPVTLRVRSNAPPGFTTVILDGDRAVASGGGPDLAVVAPSESGVFRAEIRATGWPGQPVWIVSNPIYVRAGDEAAERSLPPPVTSSAPLFDGRSSAGWRIESSPTSRAGLSIVQAEGQGAALQFQYALGAGLPRDQFAALVVETPQGVAPHDRVSLRVRADRPMRATVQARVAVSPSADDRWSRSVYVDRTDRDVTVPFEDMTAVGITRTPGPQLTEIHSLVFAVELVNARPGSSGRLWLTRVELQR